MNTSTTDAILQSSGRSPRFRDAQKIVVKIGAILVAMSFNSLGGIPSGPVMWLQVAQNSSCSMDGEVGYGLIKTSSKVIWGTGGKDRRELVI